MKRKPKKKTKNNSESLPLKGKETNAASSGVSDHESEEQPFNFGGLPNRDLKKNLGCG